MQSDEEYTTNDHISPRHQGTLPNSFSYSSSPPETRTVYPQYEHQYWRAVDRCPWENENPTISQVTQHPALNRPAPLMATSLNSRNFRNQNSMDQHTPQYKHQPHTPREDGRASDTKPQLTFSLLKQHNNNHTATTSMETWENQRQRDDAWNNVGYVCRKNDGYEDAKDNESNWRRT
jgi:hypothetical protein